MTKIGDIMGRLPFPPDKKAPKLIRKEEYVDGIYPPAAPEFADLTRFIVSTDKLLVGTYQLAPGGSFNPPDLHPGDETYYVLDGTLTQQNAVNGQVIRAYKGESIWMPREAWHKAFNFEDEILRILFFIAPKAWDEKIPPDDYPGGADIKAYKGQHNDKYPKLPVIQKSHLIGTTDDIGRWPIPGPDGRQDPKLFFRIREEDKLLNIYDYDNPMLIKFFVSNDIMHMGEFVMPAGGKGVRLSPVDVHKGDCVLFAIDGPITVYLPKTEEAFIVNVEDSMFIPEGMPYRLMNFNAKPIKAIFSIAPGL
jgi:gentisate 1,2-dioxygenase